MQENTQRQHLEIVQIIMEKMWQGYAKQDCIKIVLL